MTTKPKMYQSAGDIIMAKISTIDNEGVVIENGEKRRQRGR